MNNPVVMYASNKGDPLTLPTATAGRGRVVVVSLGDGQRAHPLRRIRRRRLWRQAGGGGRGCLDGGEALVVQHWRLAQLVLGQVGHAGVVRALLGRRHVVAAADARKKFIYGKNELTG